MAVSVPPPPFTAPTVDQSGQMTKIWRDWFTQIFQTKLGGTLASSIGELGSGISTLTSSVSGLSTTVSGLSGTVATHTSQIATLRADVDGLLQGRQL